MKFLVVLLVSVLAVSTSGHRHVRIGNVNNDIQDLINVIPRGQIEEKVKEYIAGDEEVKGDWEWVTSEAATSKIIELENTEEFKKVRKQLEDHKLDFVRFANMVHDILGMPHLSRSAKVGDGLRGLLNQVKGMIPMAKIKLMVGEKYVFHVDFRNLANLLKSDGFAADASAIGQTQPAIDLYNDAVAHNVDFQAIKDFFSSLAKLIIIDGKININDMLHLKH